MVECRFWTACAEHYESCWVTPPVKDDAASRGNVRGPQKIVSTALGAGLSNGATSAMGALSLMLSDGRNASFKESPTDLLHPSRLKGGLMDEQRTTAGSLHEALAWPGVAAEADAPTVCVPHHQSPCIRAMVHRDESDARKACTYRVYIVTAAPQHLTC